ncbi:MAG TPA: DUF1330 domain-containing protein [Telluria sp.]|nr:DUF1330 domain-containing protein [Telluria sp.]
MSVYLIAEISIHDGTWVPDYAAHVHAIAERFGGKYLARSGNIVTLEGQTKECTLVAVIQFPSAEHVAAFATSPDYQPFAKARRVGSSGVFYTIDDTDLAGTIPYLKAA